MGQYRQQGPPSQQRYASPNSQQRPGYGNLPTPPASSSSKPSQSPTTRSFGSNPYAIASNAMNGAKSGNKN
ncbi:unnamed protein product [[Candida] boidinii]|nr:unnamed protein product [[Candida] boidinii]GMF83067.1 unnamed protein product [[Candida] boidinii]